MRLGSWRKTDAEPAVDEAGGQRPDRSVTLVLLEMRVSMPNKLLFPLLCLSLACGDDVGDGNGSTTSPAEDQAPEEPPLLQRDDLPACDARAPQYEEVAYLDDAERDRWAQYEEVVICPGDQLAFSLSLSYAFDGVDVVVADGDPSSLVVAVDYTPSPVEADGNVFAIPRDPYAETCETASYPITVHLPADAASEVRFDVLVGPVTDDVCTGGTG